MSKLKCVGRVITRSKKSDKPMLILSCIGPEMKSDDGTRVGNSVETVFASLENSENIFGMSKNDVALTNFVGKEIEVSYNRSGFTDKITIVK